MQIPIQSGSQEAKSERPGVLPRLRLLRKQWNRLLRRPETRRGAEMPTPEVVAWADTEIDVRRPLP